MIRTSRTTRITTALLTVPLTLALGAGTALATDRSDVAAARAAGGGTSVAMVLASDSKAADKADRAAGSASDDGAARSVRAAAKDDAPAPAAARADDKADDKTDRSRSGSKAGTSADPDKHGTATSGPLTSPQPISKADSGGTGANPGPSCTHAYCSTRDGSASQNGKGDGAATGKPCAGCVGKADNKNPKGQAPNGSDHNAGYECDRNQGIGKGNPAHTGCTSTPTTPPTTPPVKTCPNGSAMPAGGTCPTPPVKTCPNGSAMPAGGTCPTPPVKTCSDGSPLPATGSKHCPKGTEKVTICHATGSGFVVITPSVKGVLHGHVGHQGGRDVIPAFTWSGGSFAGQNWDAAGRAFMANGCATPGTPGTPVTPVVPVIPGTPTVPGTPTAPVCPTVVLGPVPAGCPTPGTPGTPVPPVTGGGTTVVVPPVTPISGGVAAPATGPVAAPVVPTRRTVVPTAGASRPLSGTVANGAVLPAAIASPSALPFTGTDATLLVSLAGLLLVAGTVVTVAARKERTARAA